MLIKSFLYQEAEGRNGYKELIITFDYLAKKDMPTSNSQAAIVLFLDLNESLTQLLSVPLNFKLFPMIF